MKTLLLLALTMLTLQATTCNIYKVEDLTDSSKTVYPKNATIKYDLVGNILFTRIAGQVFESIRVKTLDGKTKSGIKYQGYRQKNGFVNLIYGNFKEGVFSYTADLKTFETITDCK